MTLPAPTKPQRLLDLLAFLAAHRFPVRTERILNEVPGYSRANSEAAPASVRRKFERDKAELLDAGIHIEMIHARPGYGDEDVRYRLRSRDFYLPILKLLRDEGSSSRPPAGRRPELRVHPPELRLALEGLAHAEGLPSFPFRAAARSALRKLTFDLVGEEGTELSGLDDPAPPVLHLTRGPEELIQEHLAQLSDALLRRKRTDFRYYAIGRDRRTDRRVEPRGLVYQGSRWYLVAHDIDRRDQRVFRVDRIDQVEVNSSRPRSADFERPGDFSLDDFRERAPWELGDEDQEPERIVVRFEPPLHLLAERNGWGAPGVADGTEGDPPRERTFLASQRAPLLRWVLSHCGRARVIAPLPAVAAFRACRDRAREAHGLEPGTASPAGASS